MRAILMETMSDPFLNMLWFNHAKRWFDKVDTVYILFNSPLENDVIKFLLDYTKHPKVFQFYRNTHLDHGPAMKMLLSAVKEDCVMLMEDDAFILNPDYLDEQFKALETKEYDIIGSRRGSTTQPLIDRMGKVFGVDTSWRNGGGASYWPNFLFTSRQRLLDTDRNFGSKQWEVGDYIRELDYTVTEKTPSDTFVWASIQLMSKHPKMKDVKQYHCYPMWQGDKREKTNVFSPDCPWIHVGSLSGGIAGFLIDKNGWPLSSSHKETTPKKYEISHKPRGEAEYLEYQRRMAFYRMAYELYVNEASDIKEFADRYIWAINMACSYLGLDAGDIEAQKNSYMGLLKI